MLKVCLWVHVFTSLMPSRARCAVIMPVAGEERFSKSETFLTKTIKNYFPRETNLLLFLSSSNEIGNHITKLPYPVIVLSKDFVLENGLDQVLNMQGFIFVTVCNLSLSDQTVEALEMLDKNTNSWFKTRRILVISVCFESDYSKLHYYHTYLKFLWDHYELVHVAVLPVYENCNLPEVGNQEAILTYNPFVSRNLTSENIEAYSGRENFNNNFKKFRNVGGYQLKGVLGPFTGNDLQMYREQSKDFSCILESQFNVTLTIQSGSKCIHCYSLSEEECDWVVNGSEESIADVYVKPYLLSSNISSSLQPLMSIKMKSYEIIITKFQVENWKFIIYVFDKKMWAGIGLTCVLLHLCHLVLLKIQISPDTSLPKERIYSGLAQVSIAIFAATNSKLPTRTSQRILLGLSMWFGLIITTLLIGGTIKFMRSKPILQPIRSLQDLQDSDITIFVPFDFRQLNSTLNKLFNNSKRLHFDNLPKAEDASHHAILMSAHEVELLFARRNMKEKYYKLKDTFNSLPESSAMSVGNALFEHFNTLICRLHQTGYFTWWDLTFTSAFESLLRTHVRSEVIPASNDSNTQTALSYEDLTLAFYLLYFGLALSGLCFFIEGTLKCISNV